MARWETSEVQADMFLRRPAIYIPKKQPHHRWVKRKKKQIQQWRLHSFVFSTNWILEPVAIRRGVLDFQIKPYLLNRVLLNATLCHVGRHTTRMAGHLSEDAYLQEHSSIIVQTSMNHLSDGCVMCCWQQEGVGTEKLFVVLVLQ